MSPDDLFAVEESADPSAAMNRDPWSSLGSSQTVLRRDLLDALRRGPVAEHDDLDVAIALVQLIEKVLEAFGTGGGERLDDAETALALRACTALLKRLEIDLSFPFRDLAGFRSYWIEQGMSYSWQARRSYVQQLFEPVIARLFGLDDARLEAVTATPVTPRANTGWPGVDVEIREMIKRFRAATTPQDYRAVGGNSVGVLEALGDAIYDPVAHLRPGETAIPRDRTKDRLDRYVERRARMQWSV